jgi:hypothetical protein
MAQLKLSRVEAARQIYRKGGLNLSPEMVLEQLTKSGYPSVDRSTLRDARKSVEKENKKKERSMQVTKPKEVKPDLEMLKEQISSPLTKTSTNTTPATAAIPSTPPVQLAVNHTPEIGSSVDLLKFSRFVSLVKGVGLTPFLQVVDFSRGCTPDQVKYMVDLLTQIQTKD